MNILCIGSQRQQRSAAEILTNFHRYRRFPNSGLYDSACNDIWNLQALEYQLLTSVYHSPSGLAGSKRMKNNIYYWADILETQKHFDQAINLRYCHLNRGLNEYSQIVHNVSMVIIFINANDKFNHKYPTSKEIDNFNKQYCQKHSEQTMRMDISNHYGSHLAKKKLFYLLCFNSLKKQNRLNKLPIWFVLDENYGRGRPTKKDSNGQNENDNLDDDESKAVDDDNKPNSEIKKKDSVNSDKLIINDGNRKQTLNGIKLYLSSLASNRKITSFDEIPNNIHFIESSSIMQEINIDNKWYCKYLTSKDGKLVQCYFYQLFVALMISKTMNLNLKLLSQSLITIKLNTKNEKDASIDGIVEFSAKNTEEKEDLEESDLESQSNVKTQSKNMKNDSNEHNTAVVAISQFFRKKGIGFIVVGTVIDGSYDLESAASSTASKQGKTLAELVSEPIQVENYAVPLPYRREYRNHGDFYDSFRCRSIQINGKNVTRIKKGDYVGINITNIKRKEAGMMMNNCSKARWLILSNTVNINSNNSSNNDPFSKAGDDSIGKQLYLNELNMGIKFQSKWYQCRGLKWGDLRIPTMKLRQLCQDKYIKHNYSNMIHCEIRNFGRYYGNCKGGIGEGSDLHIFYATNRATFKVCKILKDEIKEFTIDTCQLWKVFDSTIRQVYNNKIVLPNDIIKEILLTIHDLEYYMKNVVRNYETANVIVVPNMEFAYCITNPFNRFTIVSSNEVVGYGTFLKPKYYNSNVKERPKTPELK